MSTFVDVVTGDGALVMDEVKIMQGAMRLRNLAVKDIMTPVDKVFMLDADAVLNEKLLLDVMAAAHSRIPVYRKTRNNIIGMILTKRLLMVDPKQNRPVFQVSISTALAPTYQ